VSLYILTIGVYRVTSSFFFDAGAAMSSALVSSRFEEVVMSVLGNRWVQELGFLQLAKRKMSSTSTRLSQMDTIRAAISSSNRSAKVGRIRRKY
jgi:hypothetical protein